MIIIDAKHPAPDVRLRPVHGDRWGKEWVFNEKNLTLQHLVEDRCNWEVDLERCTNNDTILMFIIAASRRGYDVSALVKALTDLLMCPDDEPLNPTKWLKRPRHPKDVSKAEFDATWKKFRDAQRIEQIAPAQEGL